MITVTCGREGTTFGTFHYDGVHDPVIVGNGATMRRILALKSADMDMATFLRSLPMRLYGVNWASVQDDGAQKGQPVAFPPFPAAPGDKTRFPDYPAKFNQNHDELGRFGAGDGGGATGQAGATASSGGRSGAGLAAALIANGGFTYQPHGREHFPSKGLALSIYPDRSVVISGRPVTADDLKSYLHDNAKLLQDKSNYAGAWHEVETGRVFLDISKVVKTDAEANALCMAHGQRAYFNLADFSTVTVMDESQAHQVLGKAAPKKAAPDKKKIVAHVIPRDASAAELEALAAQINKATQK